MAGMRAPNYFGSLYDDQNEPFARQVLAQRQGLIGTQGLASSFDQARQVEFQLQQKLQQEAIADAQRQQSYVTSLAGQARTAAERARAEAIADQKARAEEARFGSELELKKQQQADQLALAANQERYRQLQDQKNRELQDLEFMYQKNQSRMNPVFSDYSALFGGDGRGAERLNNEWKMYGTIAGSPPTQGYTGKIGNGNQYITGWTAPTQQDLQAQQAQYNDQRRQLLMKFDPLMSATPQFDPTPIVRK